MLSWHYLTFRTDAGECALYSEDAELLVRMGKMPFAHKDDAKALGQFIMDRLNSAYAKQEGFCPILGYDVTKSEYRG